MLSHKVVVIIPSQLQSFVSRARLWGFLTSHLPGTLTMATEGGASRSYYKPGL